MTTFAFQNIPPAGAPARPAQKQPGSASPPHSQEASAEDAQAWALNARSGLQKAAHTGPGPSGLGESRLCPRGCPVPSLPWPRRGQTRCETPPLPTPGSLSAGGRGGGMGPGLLVFPDPGGTGLVRMCPPARAHVLSSCGSQGHARPTVQREWLCVSGAQGPRGLGQAARGLRGFGPPGIPPPGRLSGWNALCHPPSS